MLLLHLGVTNEDKNKRTVKPKPITLPVDAKPPKERKYRSFSKIPHTLNYVTFKWCIPTMLTSTVLKTAVATATPVNTSLSQGSTDSTPSGRPAYPRTQYTISRAHVTIDQNAMASSQPPESAYASHTTHSGYEPGGYQW